LDTPEVNAFAAPGGLILVTRGLLRCCQSEDAVAAVLAHEIAHVQLAHGINAIKKGRLTSALTTLATESAKSFGGQQLADLTTAFEGSIGDITATLVNSGYSRSQEYEADAAAVAILQRVGYNPAGLREMLVEMQSHVNAGEQTGFGKTHPDPRDRVTELQPLLRNAVPVAPPVARNARFERALSGV
jgi:predicted Zn-dependent protease